MAQGGGIAGVLKLPDHLLVGENLAGIVAGQLEQAAQERRLIDTAQKQDVAGDCGLDKGVADIAPPPFLLPDE